MASHKKTPLSAIQTLQETADTIIDELDTVDNSEEKKKEVLNRITTQIDSVLKSLKEGQLSMRDFTQHEKIELLEKTKIAVQEFLVNILSTQSSARAYEALANIIRVNAELIRQLEESEGVISSQNGTVQSSQEDGARQIIVAPSEALLDKIMDLRHNRSKKKDTAKSSHIVRDSVDSEG